MQTHGRRTFLASIGALGAAYAVGCGRAAGEPGVLRLGIQANLTHAPILAGLGSGRLADALAPLSGLRLDASPFRAGPRIAEALLGRAIDVGVLGPLPVVSMQSRHPGTCRIELGIASGGASLVTLPDIREPRALEGRRVATPQLGSTQDVALRKYLLGFGLGPVERGGNVVIDALASADIFAQMKRKQIAAAWLPEPWATRVVRELPGNRLVDERDLWPNHRFPTAIVVVRRAFAEARPAELAALVAALRLEIERTAIEPELTKELANVELARITTKKLPKATLDEAWAHIDFGVDPYPAAVAQSAEDARVVGYVPAVDCAPLFV